MRFSRSIFFLLVLVFSLPATVFAQSGQPAVPAQPGDDHIARARTEGRIDGRKQGAMDGQRRGHDAGRIAGYNHGFRSGYIQCSEYGPSEYHGQDFAEDTEHKSQIGTNALLFTSQTTPRRRNHEERKAYDRGYKAGYRETYEIAFTQAQRSAFYEAEPIGYQSGCEAATSDKP